MFTTLADVFDSKVLLCLLVQWLGSGLDSQSEQSCDELYVIYFGKCIL